MSAEIQTLLGSVPEEVRTSLAAEFEGLEFRFAKGDWGPSELNGGRYAEALLRYLEWKMAGSFTPLGTQINRTGIINRTMNDTSLPEGIRFHVRRCADLLLDFRNKRDVAHLGATNEVNEMDSHLVMRLAAWSFSEIIREEGVISPHDAQAIIDRLSSTHIPLVEEIDGDLLVVATGLPTSRRAMVALYFSYPTPIDIEDLRLSVRYQNKSRFPAVLKPAITAGRAHRKGDQVFITRKGLNWVEANISFNQPL